MKYANEVHVELLRGDKKLRKIHLQNAMNMIFTDDRRIALLMIRDVINASIGFKALADELNTTDKNLMGMLTIKSNPTIDNIARILSVLINYEDLVSETKLKKRA